MKSFSGLLEGLLYAPGRNAKLSWLQDWLADTPDPDRGWGLAALTGELDFPACQGRAGKRAGRCFQ